jgi:hypothetical protein
MLTVRVPRVEEVDLDPFENPHFAKHSEELCELLVLVLFSTVVHYQVEDWRKLPARVWNKARRDAGVQVVDELATMKSF